MMLKNYLITAFKIFNRRKFITFISLFGISITLMVLMVAVAFLDAMFGPNPPETRQDRILGLYSIHLTNMEGTSFFNSPPGDKFLDLFARDIPGVEKISIIGKAGLYSFEHNGERVQAYFKNVDSVFWQIMDFTFIEGSPYTEDDVKNRNSVAVINESTRNRLFGKEPAVGKTVYGFRIVGVVKDVTSLKQISFSDVWTATGFFKVYALFLARSAADVPAIKANYQMRLKSAELGIPGIGGVDPFIYNIWERVDSRLETFLELKMREQITENSDFGSDRSYTTSSFDTNLDTWEVKTKNPFREESLASRTMFLIIILIILFMLLPTVNLVNINVSRITERMSEIGVRKAFGASSRTLVGQFITENIILTLAGGILGFIFTRLVLYYITLSGWIPYTVFHLNYRIFLYALLLALFFGLMSGVYPAWRMSRLHPVAALRTSITGRS